MSKYEELKAAYVASTQTEWQVSPTLRPDLDDDPMCEYTLDNQKDYLTNRYFNADIESDELDRVHNENRANAEFIALTHNLMPALLADLNRLEKLDGSLQKPGIESALNEVNSNQLPVGTRIISIQGETSDTDSVHDVFTGPNAQGVISQVLPGKEHCYMVDFPLGVSVFLSPDEVADSDRYAVSSSREGFKRHNVHIYAIVRVKVCDIETGNHAEAIQKAGALVDLNALFNKGSDQEFADDIDCYLVDEIGDEEFTNSRWYEKDGVTPMAKSQGKAS